MPLKGKLRQKVLRGKQREKVDKKKADYQEDLKKSRADSAAQSHEGYMKDPQKGCATSCRQASISS